jgi:hypothetical protein
LASEDEADTVRAQITRVVYYWGYPAVDAHGRTNMSRPLEPRCVNSRGIDGYGHGIHGGPVGLAGVNAGIHAGRP